MYSPKHKLTSMSRKAKTLTVFAVASIAAIGTAMLAGASSASITNNTVWTSNGEAGYFTWSADAFSDVHSQLILTAAAEGMGTNGGTGLGLCGNTSSTTGQAQQLGAIWNASENAFDVYWNEGGVTAHTPNTKGSACTTGGALAPVPAQEVLTGVNVGDKVYLEIRHWKSHTQFIAEDLTQGFGNDLNDTVAPGFAYHFAQAGTVFDTTGRSAPATTQEAQFALLRARAGSSGDQVFGHWLAQEVQSSANGTAADPALVTPDAQLGHPYGGIFDLFVGGETGA